jgi:hypothetical protein
LRQAIICYAGKQPIASNLQDSSCMNAKRAPNINAVLAENIRALMDKKQLDRAFLRPDAALGFVLIPTIAKDCLTS